MEEYDEEYEEADEGWEEPNEIDWWGEPSIYW